MLIRHWLTYEGFELSLYERSMEILLAIIKLYEFKLEYSFDITLKLIYRGVILEARTG